MLHPSLVNQKKSIGRSDAHAAVLLLAAPPMVMMTCIRKRRFGRLKNTYTDGGWDPTEDQHMAGIGIAEFTSTRG